MNTLTHTCQVSATTTPTTTSIYSFNFRLFSNVYTSFSFSISSVSFSSHVLLAANVFSSVSIRKFMFSHFSFGRTKCRHQICCVFCCFYTTTHKLSLAPIKTSKRRRKKSRTEAKCAENFTSIRIGPVFYDVSRLQSLLDL